MVLRILAKISLAYLSLHVPNFVKSRARDWGNVYQSGSASYQNWADTYQLPKKKVGTQVPQL